MFRALKKPLISTIIDRDQTVVFKIQECTLEQDCGAAHASGGTAHSYSFVNHSSKNILLLSLI